MPPPLTEVVHRSPLYHLPHDDCIPKLSAGRLYGCDPVLRIQERRDMGPTARPPPHSFLDDPALIVALILTGVMLLLGFSATVCSGRLWKRTPSTAKKSLPLNMSSRSFASTSAPHNHDGVRRYYLKPIDLSPFSSDIPSVKVGHVAPGEVEFDHSRPISLHHNANATSSRGTTLSLPRPRTWNHSWIPSPLHGDPTASSVGLFSVPEVDEELESGESASESPIITMDIAMAGLHRHSIKDTTWPATADGLVQQSPDSLGSTEKTETEPGIFDTVNAADSETSLTSFEGSPEEESEEEDVISGDTEEVEVEVFEVKRGHTQSLELAKGVLVVLPADSSSSEDLHKRPISIPPEKNIIVADKNMQRSKTLPNFQVRRPTFLPTFMSKPQIPALIVTQPSTLSLFTVGSSASDTSVDLGKFPLPPLHLEPTVFWQKLEEEINHSLSAKKPRT
ncbi:hypothetical protein CC1G_06813 [Coprinopsis cinerea okayama7|uniref:Uncharacterized protein n=1 Tax=Coprinopsis cinerea (strain Okayama-7 / 130 / ATCC MYA-4618 / FGSC 9003) TaxID=240176 RepID=A8N6U1_COPC7|nr:hypothetical protein CC1G_06813 [Coprinopsis cinerea okayama7\|eukprot:XP_001830547.2 hypothetical protein CC1G_06813 [Coprinopsis cinerea okayama7\